MNEALPGLVIMNEEGSKELAPLTVIRTETALSRFPVHRIAKKGNVRIELKNQPSALLWRVSHNSEYGQPGPLAYRLDTWVVNRRIDASGRPVPKIIRLGTLSELGAELGAGRNNTGSVKQALLQNAFAGISAKISYRATDRSERTLEAAFTRYSVIFTGETLPDGRSADAVHLVLNDVYMEVLNSAVVRPLDYDYMKALTPAAQRFYEIVSYQIYAALLHRNERAKLRYSEYCMLSTATRYLDFDHVKKQMHKIHGPHIEKGYIARVTYEQTVDETGQPDWFMWYTPGVNAAREYQEFTQTGRRNKQKNPSGEDPSEAYETLSLPFGDPEPVTASAPKDASVSKTEKPVPLPTIQNESDQATAALATKLINAGLNKSVAQAFAADNPEECQRQLEYLLYAPPIKTSKGAYLRRAIEQGFAPPEAYQKIQAEAAERKRKQEETASRNARKAAQEAQRAAEIEKWGEAMAELQNNDLQAFSGFLSYVASEREQEELKNAKMPPPVRARMLKVFDGTEKQIERFATWDKLRAANQLPPEFVSSDPEPNQSRNDDPSESESVAAVRAVLNSRFNSTNDS